MTTYSLYLPPLGSTEPPAETFRLVPDKKSPWALIAPAIWLLYHRLWLELLVYSVVMAALLLVFYWKPHIAIIYLSGLPGLYLLLEGQELVRARLERTGWRFAGVVEGEDKQEAEIRFLATSKVEFPAASDKPASEPQIFRKPARITNSLFPE